MTNQTTRRQALVLLTGAAFVASSRQALAAKLPKEPAPPPGNPVVAIVGQVAGLGFYEASRDGAQEALTEIGGVDLVYVAPATATAKDQIQLVNDLIKQKVSAIVISPVDGAALSLVCRRAIGRGIKVVSYEKALPRESRMLHLEATTVPATAQAFLKMMVQALPDGGDIGILAGDRHSDDDKTIVNALIREWIKSDYARLKLADTVYGNGDDVKAYAATESLVATHPTLRGIIATHPTALTAAARYVVDKGLSGKVFVTGLGQPSQLQASVAAGAISSFAIANPVDLGYAAARMAVALVKNELVAKPGASVAGGRVGDIRIGDANVAVLGQPFVVDQANFEKFHQMF